jgi:hypothetical protein
MKQEYLLNKAKNYLITGNFKRCIESCINVLTYQKITKHVLCHLEEIIYAISCLPINNNSLLPDLDSFEDFLAMIKGIDENNLSYPLFSLHYAHFLVLHKHEKKEYISKIIENAIIKTDNSLFHIYAGIIATKMYNLKS